MLLGVSFSAAFAARCQPALCVSRFFRAPRTGVFGIVAERTNRAIVGESPFIFSTDICA